MKRSRLLALTLVVALLLMGAGYAFWSETLAINGTVDTGELDFEFTGVTLDKGEYVRGTANRTDNKHTLDLKLKDMHPGAIATVGFSIKNIGTIGLKVEDFDFKFDESESFSEKHLLVLVNGNVEDNGDSKLKSVEEYFEKFGNSLIGAEVNGNNGDNGDNGDNVINPGEQSEPVEITFVIDPCVDENDFPENGRFTFSINAKVKQYNDDGRCDEDDSEEPEDPPTGSCVPRWWWPNWLKWPKNWFRWGYDCGC